MTTIDLARLQQRYEDLVCDFGLHPDTDHETVRAHIESVRREARESADAFTRGTAYGMRMSPHRAPLARPDDASMIQCQFDSVDFPKAVVSALDELDDRLGTIEREISERDTPMPLPSNDGTVHQGPIAQQRATYAVTMKKLDAEVARLFAQQDGS